MADRGDCVEVLGFKVTDTDRRGEPVLLQNLELLPRVDIGSALRSRPVNQVQVKVVKLELGQRFAESALNILLFTLVKLGGDEYLLTLDLASGKNLL